VKELVKNQWVSGWLLDLFSFWEWCLYSRDVFLEPWEYILITTQHWFLTSFSLVSLCVLSKSLSFYRRLKLQQEEV
jgi:hypothetical protein